MIDYLISWTQGWVGNLHLASALFALVSGLLVLVLRKGTTTHVLLGYLYVISMLSVNLSALFKYDLTGAINFFHIAAVASLITVMAGFRFALRYRRSGDRRAAMAHGIVMIWSYYGLCIALVAEVITRKYPFMLHGEDGWTRFSVMLIGIMLVSAFFTQKLIERQLKSFFGATE